LQYGVGQTEVCAFDEGIHAIYYFGLQLYPS